MQAVLGLMGDGRSTCATNGEIARQAHLSVPAVERCVAALCDVSLLVSDRNKNVRNLTIGPLASYM